MLIDSHCHLHDREFFTAEQAEEMIKRANKANVRRIICIGTSHKDSLAARDFAKGRRGVYWTYGVHPEHARETLPKALHTLWGDALTPVAIGEVGLDYHYDGYDREAQIRLFEQMLQIAVELDLPVVFHVREAFTDFIPVVANFPQIKGVVHSFTDSKKVLRRVLSETDFYIGVNGLATYSTLPLPPLGRILLETDAPFLAPIPHRGQTNEPAYISDVARWLADRVEGTVDEVANITTNNAVKLFGLNIDNEHNG